ncbi:erythrocyte membrane protein 1, EMP1 [Plasmodium reichenowi]|uniref:Erythrocyte membrane protein 1, EMP1 n=1 Tax=Plasmodium reichenowi TaxID=5854 RepID=A0A060RNP8_PLARE|nr:erythrocyte membrane protein 1, EMP1 [Plasmodium reichenowi]
MGTRGSGGGGGAKGKKDEPKYYQATEAKDFLDQIGQIVHKKVREEALNYVSDLQGHLSDATFKERNKIDNLDSKLCEINHIYHTNVTDGHSDPCEGRALDRFSDKQGAECDRKKIRGNNEGACAPFRRLHLCDQHLSQMNDDKINNKDNLLLEVLLAAKYEGDSLTQYHDIYHQTYTDSKICTVLARSFADIGDIVRGKDLYLGNPQESAQRNKLEDNLKKIFGKIYDKLSPKAKEYYQKDKETENFFQLREDWWEANRLQVWKAITCSAGGGTYFRKTCSNNTKDTDHNCQCIDGTVPTNFDYVPQYLRWFEEWAEDFCRKKKKKVENLDKQCRGEYQNEKRYCSRNGYDCEKTKRAIGRLRMGKGCISCLYACNPYVDWIDNQRKQFLKQKEKYINVINEISSSSRPGRSAGGTTTTKYDGYEKQFYDILKDKYKDGGGPDKFLDLLNKEDVCTKITDEKEGRINFEKVNSGSAGTAASGTSGGNSGTNDKNEGTFYRSEYCQPCPHCGVKKNNNDGSGKEWEEKSDTDQCNIKLYKPKPGKNGTPIEILKSGENHNDIKQKLEQFCKTQNGTVAGVGGKGGGSGGNGVTGNSSSKELYEEWKCYQFDQLDKVGNGDDDEEYDNEVETGGGLCILENKKHESEKKSADEPKELQKTFNDFFYYWVAHMLKDSIHWKKKLDKCLKKGKAINCKNNTCKSDCECFKNWVGQKETEWGNIKDHYYMQKGMRDRDVPPETILEFNLRDEFLKGDSEEKSQEDNQNSLDSEEIKHLKEINKMLKDEEKAEAGAPGSGQKTIMDKLIHHEKDEAEDCLDTHEDEEEEGGDADDDECDDHHEEPTIMRPNPCTGESGSTSGRSRHPALATKVAEDMHLEARKQLGGSRSVLKGNIKNVTFRDGDTVKVLTKVCEITVKHNNDIKGIPTDGPCKDKGDGFEIGTDWKTGGKVNISDEHLFLPPRRQHFCTSNLEKLNVGSVSGNNNVNDKFLVEVLLSANKQAEWIKEKYKDTNGKTENKGKCRALRRSFADIGDIIKGTDLWNQNVDEIKTQTALKSVFDKIKTELESKLNGKDKDKYAKDNENKQLREDWWTANRRQVWKAMRCAIRKGKIPCPGMPVEDYIPQRLRWMTEWAEWYCKAQNKYYGDLLRDCGKCTVLENGKKCYKDTEGCTQCADQCKEYERKIKKWEKQWDKMNQKYVTLYGQAKTASPGTSFLQVDPDYKQVVDFLAQLCRASITASGLTRPKRDTNGGDSVYASAARYVHQELGTNMGCQEQTLFCNNNETKDKYAFRKKPKFYDDACSCDTRNKPEPKKEDACKIVNTLFTTKDSLNEACDLKYNKGKYYGWRCVNPTKTGERTTREGNDRGKEGVRVRTARAAGTPESGEKSSGDDNGSICVPQRRRRLYLHKVDDGEFDRTTASLREWFVKSAAVETFFLWDRYKKLKKKPRGEAGVAGAALTTLTGESIPSTEDGDEDPDAQLKNGEIPPSFLRQMFYTIADYRDILVRGGDKASDSGSDGKDSSSSNNDNIVLLVSENKEEMKAIQKQIDKILKKQSGDKKPGEKPNSEREEFWKQHGKDIWDGMLCSLTYKDNDVKGGKPQKVEAAKGGKDLFQELKGKYGIYTNVTLEDDSDTSRAKGVDESASGDKTTLDSFVKRPPYFRYLEEWGESFCVMRKKMLEKIRVGCIDESGKNKKQKYSGDGEACDRRNTSNGVSADLEGSSCAKPCSSYRKWIKTKKTEFEKQKEAYSKQKTDAEGKSNIYDKNFVQKLKSDYSSINLFLQKLGPCKNESAEDNKIFDDNGDTFRYEKYCGTCPEFKIDCGSGKCSGSTNGKDCNGGKITAESFKDKTDSKEVVMRVSDKSANGFDDLKDVCKDAHIFKGVRKEEWTCGNVCGLDVCKLKKVNGEKDNDKKILLIRALLKRWVEYFLEDYNKMNAKISHCTHNSEGNMCKNDCQNKCKCVGEWITKKREEWQQIKKDYLEKNKDDSDIDIKSLVRSFLETLQSQTEVNKIKGKHNKLRDFEDSPECNGTENSKNKKDGKNSDIIDCLIENLQQKITECPSSPSGHTPQTACETPTLDEDIDTPDILDENPDQTTIEAPRVCDTVMDKKETENAKKEKKKKDEDDVCKVVEGHFSMHKNGKKGINGCNPKTPPFDWNCNDKQLVPNDGTCMPPRRNKLCINDLKELKDQSSTEEELRKAFIKCAAKEIYFSWERYKQDHSDADNKLKSGEIPDEFKRQMFYTFGDYRDLLFGTDMLKNNVNTINVNENINKIFNNNKSLDKETDNSKRVAWWIQNRSDIWQAMICGLTQKLDDTFREKARTKLTTTYAYHNITFSDNTTLEEFSQTPQFLRWFTEWADDFCIQRKKQLETLKTACEEYDCNVENMDEKKKTCEEACQKYQKWIETWRTQYECQREKFKKDKDTNKYKDYHSTVSDINNARDAHDYLITKINNCHGTCECLKEISAKTNPKTQTEETKSPGTKSDTSNNKIPKTLEYPPKEIGDKCNCPKLPEPKYCVEKTAYDIRKEAETKVKNIDCNLKTDGKDFNGECNRVIKEKGTTANRVNSCDFEKTYKNSLNKINNKCEDNGKERYQIGQTWNSKYIKDIGKHLCIPPRREHMCLDDFKTLWSFTISDSNSLLKIIQQAAKTEGDYIIKKLLPKYPCNEDVICKAMKYSFADLGDIIRGRDMLKGINRANAYEATLNDVFDKIKRKCISDNIKHKDKYTNLQSFRSSWWDANRKDIWKAMTCNAPDEAKIYITKEGGYISPLTSTKNKCGHNDDPPDYDYIPQPLRWISEWSETYCLAQKDLLESMKICEHCKKKDNNEKCQPNVHGACTNCKKKCEKYKEFVESWKKQFEIQKKAYEGIYKKASTSNVRYFNGIDENTKNFVKKLKENCKTNLNTADKYLEGGSVCRRFKFVTTDTHDKNYAFHNTPPSHEEHCECAKKFDPLNECPVDTDVCNKYGTYPCRTKKLNKEIEDWTNHFVKKSIRNYEAVMVPPRRRQLCLVSISTYGGRINTEKKFKEYILHAASNEAKVLWNVHKSDEKKALQAIKYSFADYGNIVKGDDMLNTLEFVEKRLNEIFKQNSNENENVSEKRKKWWENNKEKIWNVMMCHYNGSDKKKDSCPSHGKIDEEDQFLRWMTEWAEYFCKEKKKEVSDLVEKCRTEITTKGLSSDKQIKKIPCYKDLQKYDHWLYNKKLEWNELSEKYEADYKEISRSKSTSMPQKAKQYVDQKCKECTCNFDDIITKYDKSGNGVSIIHSLIKHIHPGRTCGPDTSVNEDKKAPEKPSPPPQPPPLLPPADQPFDPTILQSTIPFGIALALTSIAFFFMKKKSKPPVDFFSVLEIPKSDYDIPTFKSSNRYIPYTSGKYRGKRYIYLEGDSGTDSGYTDHYSDITSSSESEYEEFDINDIYVPGTPKYKTLIEVVLEPSTSGKNAPNSGNTIPTSDIPNTPSDTTNTPSDTPPPIADNEWNELKQNFISNMLQNTEPNNNYRSGDIPTNTNNTNMSHDNVDNNAHPTTSRDTLDQKPFIMSIHDRNLYTGEEYSYDMANIVDSPYSGIDPTSSNHISLSGNLDSYSGTKGPYSGTKGPYSGNRDSYSGIDPTSGNHNLLSDNRDSYSGTKGPYSGTDLINDSLSGNHDIYNELLKRKENELFGTNNVKQTSTHSVASPTNSDPIHNQLELFHKWLDRHRNMCEKWENHHERLPKLKELWENETHSGKLSDNTIRTSDIPSGKHVLNSDVSIQIDMDNPKPTNEFTNMDTYSNNSSMDNILEDLEKYNEPYYDFYEDDIYYDVNDDKTSVDHINMDYNKMDNNNLDVPTKVQIEMNIVNNKKEIFEEEYPMSDIWNI